jgi:hypothetical protein
MWAYTCPCCGEDIVVPNPFDVTCPCCGERSGIRISLDHIDDDNSTTEKE